MLKINGFLDDVLVGVTWDDGRSSGDFQVVTAVLRVSAKFEGRVVGVESGPWTTKEHLSNPLSAGLFIGLAFDQVETIEEDVEVKVELGATEGH